jgi:hypothetical protein
MHRMTVVRDSKVHHGNTFLIYIPARFNYLYDFIERQWSYLKKLTFRERIKNEPTLNQVQ